MIAWKDLKSRLRSEIWPSGEARTLRTVHDKFFLEAVIELQRWVTCLQKNNTTIYPFCSTYFQCGKTVTDAPKGVIHRAYTIADDEFCDKVFLSQRTIGEVDCWAHNLVMPMLLALLETGSAGPGVPDDDDDDDDDDDGGGDGGGGDGEVEGVFFVDTYFDLRAIPPAVTNQHAFVYGRLSMEDGQGGQFRWEDPMPQPDDDATYISPSAGGVAGWVKWS